MIQVVSEYLDNAAVNFPDKTAFVDDKRKVTFRELYGEAVHVADALIGKGIFKSPVLLFMEKSVSLVSCFAGVAYSGNFYSPVDTKMPADRMNKIIRTLEPAVIITDREHEAQVKDLNCSAEILIFEEIQSGQCDDQRVRSVRSRIIDTDILYVLFTSGSTGTPKGVIIDHRAVIDFTEWITDCYHLDDTTVFANQAQLYFDLSIQDVYATLKNGSTTVLIPNRLYASPIRVWKKILEHHVNTLVWIPSMLVLFANLDILANAERAPIRTVLFCGEVMPVNKLNYWIKHYPDVVYGNLYGPTECTEACTYYTIDRTFKDDEVLPIGRPCDNCEVIVLDESDNVVNEQGKTGELCVRGTCLSSGYYGDTEKTSEVFVQNPANDRYREIIYRTGDLVMYNELGELVYVCRKDHQVKIRGYRVELGEVEAAADSVPQVENCCCLFDPENEKLILVYAGSVEEKDVKALLAEKLQDYMVPDKCIRRDNIPLNNNGKTDRITLNREYLQG